MDGVSKTRIEANLRRWATSGIDHKNPDHVAAYLLVRQQHERPRPEHVLAAIKSQKGYSFELAFYVQRFLPCVERAFFEDAFLAGEMGDSRR